MNNKLTAGLAATALVVALLTGAAVLTQPNNGTGPQGVAGAQGERGPAGPQGPAGRDGSSQNLEGLSALLNGLKSVLNGLENQPSKLGAFPSPDILSPYLSVNGVTTYYEKVSFRTASSSLCELLSPPATSTLNFTAQVTTGTSSALYVLLQDIQASSTKPVKAFAPSLASATGTLRVLETLVASSKGSLVFRATSTPESSLGMNTFDRRGEVKPNTTVVFHVRPKDTAGTISQAGTGQVLLGKCNATFTEL